MVLRELFRVLAVVGTLVFTVHQTLIARQDYRNWQSAAQMRDFSARGLYRLNFRIDCAEIIVAWAFAGGLIYVLRPKSQSKP